ncbi:MAG: hypothetical protein ABI217_05570 [Chthoniobacterales bacterium]
MQGNLIGTKADGISALGNRYSGILVNASSKAVTIGGANAGEGNVVAFNYPGAAGGGFAQGGIIVDNQFTTPTGIAIRGNSIFSNGGLGIDLGGNGVTPNDTGDGDTGPNNLQNFPIITSATIAGGSANISGTLNSTASTQFTLDFFVNAACDPAGYGEGQTYLGSTQVTTASDGNGSFSVTLSTSAIGGIITATATDPAGNTSEFSVCDQAAMTVPSVLANISTRLRVETGDNVLIGGFIITGTQSKKVLLRGIGPSLTVIGKLADPTLELHDGAGVVIASNDTWQDAPNKQEIIDSTIPPTNPLESAILSSLAPGAYTAIVSGTNSTTGVALVEAYDLDQTVDSKLANISTRGLVQTGDNLMIGGFIIVGSDPLSVIARAIGPSLAVTGKLADPTLELHDGNGAVIAFNNNWKDTQEAEIIATTVPPTNDFESAVVMTLPPAAYTVIVSGVNGTTGVALVEVYALQ